ncbi:ring finger protein [Moesziomyces aphidis]|uniref:Pre-mRNA-splicing factor CWC24 n=1 Tax=Moesziomyces aphidis TaxID=84754 RepID=W3VJF5_MOEAP|nr:ring finger protein [Moesziomyces aphidis]
MDASTQSAASEPVVTFKRKRGPPSRAAPAATASPSTSSSSAAPGPSRASQAVLNTSSSDSDSDADSGDEVRSRSAVVTKKKRTNHNPLVQSTGAVRKQPRPDTAPDSEDDIYPSYSAAPASTAATSLQKIRDDATRHSNWDLDSSTPADAGESASNADGLYRGSKGYASYIAARDDGKSSKMRSRGPIRQTTTVRTTSLMDYQPDVCKDYKETGYCGFGDTCKFLHDRSDYLAGWQLDLPNSSSRAREDVLLSDPEEEDEEEVPFACLICRHAFSAPVVTKCGHYFCEACALARFAKTSKCFACGAQTGGLFNAATKVLERMNKAKAAKQQMKNSWRQLDVDD